MRIALVPDGETANTAYRSIGPLLELQKRGHEARRLDPADPRTASALMRWCDLLHVHRRCDEDVLQLVDEAKAADTTVVWDDDDDSLRPPAEFSSRQLVRGREAAARLAARARLFELVDLVTTTGPGLAEVFHADGAREVHVIENYVIDGLVGERLSRPGTTIGWAAAARARARPRPHPTRQRAVKALLAAHSDLTVVTIGIELRQLESDRYEHRRSMPMQELMRELASFDVGIAPLSPAGRMNHGRSNVKLKEYAAAGVPWLASPIGPYERLGVREGGRLVADDRWFDELDALVRNARARRRLAKRAERWGRSQLLSRSVGCWERAFERALDQARQAA